MNSYDSLIDGFILAMNSGEPRFQMVAFANKNAMLLILFEPFRVIIVLIHLKSLQV